MTGDTNQPKYRKKVKSDSGYNIIESSSKTCDKNIYCTAEHTQSKSDCRQIYNMDNISMGICKGTAKNKFGRINCKYTSVHRYYKINNKIYYENTYYFDNNDISTAIYIKE